MNPVADRGRVGLDQGLVHGQDNGNGERTVQGCRIGYRQVGHVLAREQAVGIKAERRRFLVVRPGRDVARRGDGEPGLVIRNAEGQRAQAAIPYLDRGVGCIAELRRGHLHLEGAQPDQGCRRGQGGFPGCTRPAGGLPVGRIICEGENIQPLKRGAGSACPDRPGGADFVPDFVDRDVRGRGFAEIRRVGLAQADVFAVVLEQAAVRAENPDIGGHAMLAPETQRVPGRHQDHLFRVQNDTPREIVIDPRNFPGIGR